MTHKHFIAAVMAAAISLTALAPKPAQAGDTAAIIAGAAALTIIGIGIAAAADHDRRVYVTRNVYRPRAVPRRVDVYHHRAYPRRVYRHVYHHHYHRR